MSSDAKIAANRANALKSTGPRTERGKTKSRFNAVTHGIYATPPLLPAEDEDAYRAIQNHYWEFFDPLGPVENMLAHQIADLAWRLGRIDKADAALLQQLEVAKMTRLVGTLSLKGIEFLLSELEPGFEMSKFVASQKAEASKAGTTRSRFAGPGEEEPDLTPAEKKSIADRVCQLVDIGSTMLEALVPGTENAPHECLERQRHATMRVYLSYVARLMELQACRRTLTLMPVAVGKQAPPPSTNIKRPKPLPPNQAANQNHHSPGIGETEKRPGETRTRRQIRKDLAASQI